MITLEELTVDNFDAVIALGVAENQRAFVASNVESIAQAKVQPECVPLAVCAQGTPVGFLMYCIDRDDGQWWLYRLMTDARYQGKGYARSAMAQVLAIMDADPDRRRVYLGVEPENHGAVSLYESLGFRFDGQVFGREHIMVRCRG